MDVGYKQTTNIFLFPYLFLVEPINPIQSTKELQFRIDALISFDIVEYASNQIV